MEMVVAEYAIVVSILQLHTLVSYNKTHLCFIILYY